MLGWRHVRTRTLLLGLFASGWSLPASAQPATEAKAKSSKPAKVGGHITFFGENLEGTVAPAEPETIDVASFIDKLAVVPVANDRYIVTGVRLDTPFGDQVDRYFYGNGQRFSELDTGGAGGGTFPGGPYETRIRDPRRKTWFGFRDGKYVLRCDDRSLKFVALEPSQALKMLRAAHFFTARPRRRPHALARDDRGNYYYVDRMGEAATAHDHRLFVGPRGALRQRVLTDVAVDSGGQLFVTKEGTFRLDRSATEHMEPNPAYIPPQPGQSPWFPSHIRRTRIRWTAMWVTDDRKRALVYLAALQNVELTYRDLGVYDGERFGFPCEDL